MTAGAAPRVRVSGPGDLLGTVPYLLGFTPTDSAVLVGLAGSRVEVTARLDIAHVQTDLIEQTLDSMQRGGVDQLIVAFYSDAELDPGIELCIREAVAAHEMRLLEVLLVRDGRYRSLDCTDSTCCPPEGRSMDGVTTSEVQMVYAGKAPLASREQIEHELDPLDPADAAVVEEHVRLFAGWNEHDAAEWFAGQLADDHERAAAAMSALAGALLQRLRVRDAMWLRVDDAGQDDSRAYWRMLTRRLPAPYRAATAFLYGWACFRAGDGARAAEAMRVALEADPDYSAAQLLQTALIQGVDPRRFPRLTKEDLS